MTDQNKSEEIDWSVCTWKGSRRLQHEEFRALPFARKLEIIEEMNEFSQALAKWRRSSETGKKAVRGQGSEVGD